MGPDENALVGVKSTLGTQSPFVSVPQAEATPKMPWLLKRPNPSIVSRLRVRSTFSPVNCISPFTPTSTVPEFTILVAQALNCPMPKKKKLEKKLEPKEKKPKPFREPQLIVPGLIKLPAMVCKPVLVDWVSNLKPLLTTIKPLLV